MAPQAPTNPAVASASGSPIGENSVTRTIRTTIYASYLHSNVSLTAINLTEYSGVTVTSTPYNFTLPNSSTTVVEIPTVVPVKTSTSATIPASSALISSKDNTSGAIVSTTQASQPSTTSSGTASSVPASPSKGNSNGKVIGSAIGGLVAGALLAGLLVWLIMRRKNKNQRLQRGFSEKHASTHSSSRSNDLSAAPLIAGTAVGGAAAGDTIRGAAWERHLPQSESDSTVRNAVQALYTQIELHVDNYYRDTSVQITPELQTELMKVDSNHLPDSVVGLLPQTRTPTALIKHCLAQIIISHISADEGDVKDSFLPADFTALAGSLGSSRSNASKPAFAPALSRHRVLTSYLRPSPHTDRTYMSARDAHISTAAETFTSAFAPWAKQNHTLDARRGHLVNIMKSASDTGILLFSQPSTFKYVWDMGRREDGRGAGGALKVVVLPGFVKVSDESARVLDRGQVLVEVMIATLS